MTEDEDKVQLSESHISTPFFTDNEVAHLLGAKGVPPKVTTLTPSHKQVYAQFLTMRSTIEVIQQRQAHGIKLLRSVFKNTDHLDLEDLAIRAFQNITELRKDIEQWIVEREQLQTQIKSAEETRHSAIKRVEDDWRNEFNREQGIRFQREDALKEVSRENIENTKVIWNLKNELGWYKKIYWLIYLLMFLALVISHMVR